MGPGTAGPGNGRMRGGAPGGLGAAFAPGGIGAGAFVPSARDDRLPVIKTPAIKQDVRIFDCISFKSSLFFK